jgi:hypothetical protein
MGVFMETPKNPLPAFVKRVYGACFCLANRLTRGQLKDILLECRAHRKAKRLRSSMYVTLAEYRNARSELPIPMTVRQLGHNVWCDDQSDLEIALQELIDEKQIFCFHLDVETFERLQRRENERFVLPRTAGQEALPWSPYLDSTEFRSKRIHDLANLSPTIDFWNLKVIHPSWCAVF